jgi:hypothetical protein
MRDCRFSNLTLHRLLLYLTYVCLSIWNEFRCEVLIIYATELGEDGVELVDDESSAVGTETLVVNCQLELSLFKFNKS